MLVTLKKTDLVKPGNDLSFQKGQSDQVTDT